MINVPVCLFELLKGFGLFVDFVSLNSPRCDALNLFSRPTFVQRRLHLTVLQKEGSLESSYAKF